MRMLKLFIAVVLLAGWGLAALSLHVVRTPAGLTILPKDSLAITDTYADTRNWKAVELAEHKPLLARLVATDRLDAIRHIVDSDRSGEVREWLKSITHQEYDETDEMQGLK